MTAQPPGVCSLALMAASSRISLPGILHKSRDAAFTRRVRIAAGQGGRTICCTRRCPRDSTPVPAQISERRPSLSLTPCSPDPQSRLRPRPFRSVVSRSVSTARQDSQGSRGGRSRQLPTTSGPPGPPDSTLPPALGS